MMCSLYDIVILCAMFMIFDNYVISSFLVCNLMN